MNRPYTHLWEPTENLARELRRKSQLGIYLQLLEIPKQGLTTT